MDNLYKQKYCIGIYENNSGEQLIGLFDNPKELAQFLEISIDYARVLVSQRIKGSRKQIFVDSKPYKMILIDMTDEDTKN